MQFNPYRARKNGSKDRSDKGASQALGGKYVEFVKIRPLNLVCQHVEKDIWTCTMKPPIVSQVQILAGGTCAA
jgi:hypothetical protein